MYINLNEFEKQAIAKALRLIITSDNEVSNEERLYYLNGVLPQLRMTNAEFENAKNFDTNLMWSLLKNLSKINRIELIKMMLKMMLVDGDINTKEMKTYHALCNLGGIDVDIQTYDINETALQSWFQTLSFTK